MFQILSPPTPLADISDECSVFLAGSIELGAAGNWQAVVENSLCDENLTILNPRRDEWDSTWEQSISNPQFREQVEWELDALEAATRIAMFFEPTSKAPITLLELGLFARTGKLVVCCPAGYWRKGNVEIVCTKFSVPMVATLDTLIDNIRAHAR